MNSRKKSYLFITIGCIFLLASMALGIYNIWDDYRAKATVNSILEDLQSGQEEEELPDFILNPAMEMPTKEINGYLYIGTLSIPSLDLKLPVMETWDYVRLKIAPGRYTGSAYLNNLVICAHNYIYHFGRLKNLAHGDKIKFTDIDGNVFTYKVEEVETLLPTDVEEMKSSGYDLTLFTCTLGGRTRVTVRCTKVKTKAKVK